MERQSRSTKQRMVILEELRAVRSHPTADEVYELTKARLPRISLGTVYRNLDFLVRRGEVRCLDFAGSQKRFDGDVSEHQHIRCACCGKVSDLPVLVPLPDVPALDVEGFTVTGMRLDFEGICATCRAAAD